MFFNIICSIYAISLGAVYGRIDGGGVVKFKVNEWVERFLCMFFFVVACYPFAGNYAFFALLGVFGILTGHGQYFLTRTLRGQKQGQERLDFLVELVYGEDWRVQFDRDHEFTDEESYIYNTDHYDKLYIRNVFGMFVTGFFVGLPAVILSFSYGLFWVGLLFLLTGPVKALSYVVGYKVYEDTYDAEQGTLSTVSAEYINGGLRTVLCVIVFWIVL